MTKQRLYKVIFMNQGKIYEVFARDVSQSGLFGFIEIAEIQFGEKSELIVDPSEEKIKTEFSNVKRAYIPMHAVVRIDEVEKQGTNKITDMDKDSNITPFPVYTPGNEPKKN